MKSLTDKKYNHLLWKDELGDTFLLLKYAEVYKFSEDTIRLHVWGYKIYKQIKKKGIILNEILTGEDFRIIEVEVKHLSFLIELGASKRRANITGSWIKNQEERLGHKILVFKEL